VARGASAHVREAAHQTQWLSARNQIEGTVTFIEVSGVMGEVILELPGGQEIVAAITRASVERLGLAVGDPALAIVKSTDVMLALPPRSPGAEDPAARASFPDKGSGIGAMDAREESDAAHP
jgi:molybdate transport system regulatory protein